MRNFSVRSQPCRRSRGRSSNVIWLDLRRAANEISATLAEHPSHPLLQDLLVSTYQSELELLGSVTHMTVPVLNQTSKETRL